MSKKLIVGSVEEFRNPAVLFGGYRASWDRARMSRDKFLLNCSEYCSAHVYIYTESDPFLNFQILVLLKHHGSQMLSNIWNNSMQLETQQISILNGISFNWHTLMCLCFKFWIRFQNYSQRKCVSLPRILIFQYVFD